MRFAFLIVGLLAMPLAAGAKGSTTRIEIARGKHALVTLTGEDSAGQFTIWSGPGTMAGPEEGPREMTTSSADFADWPGGVIQPPRGLRVYKVRFYCAARGDSERATVPSNQCYGVRYGIDPDTGQGFIQIPSADDKEFPLNTQSILRGVEGNWYRSSPRWEEIVRPKIDAALTSTNTTNEYWRYDPSRNYTTPPPSRTAVGAKSALPSKH
jgi:hypothetical protein